MCALELLAAADICDVSGGDVTIIRTKGIFSFQSRKHDHVNTEQRKKRSSICRVDKVKWNCDLTMQTFGEMPGGYFWNRNSSISVTKVTTFCREFHKRNTSSASWSYRKKITSRYFLYLIYVLGRHGDPTHFPANLFFFVSIRYFSQTAGC